MPRECFSKCEAQPTFKYDPINFFKTVIAASTSGTHSQFGNASLGYAFVSLDVAKQMARCRFSVSIEAEESSRRLCGLEVLMVQELHRYYETNDSNFFTSIWEFPEGLRKAMIAHVGQQPRFGTRSSLKVEVQGNGFAIVLLRIADAGAAKAFLEKWATYSKTVGDRTLKLPQGRAKKA